MTDRLPRPLVYQILPGGGERAVGRTFGPLVWDGELGLNSAPLSRTHPTPEPI
jgi:hypothetical protein